MFFNIFCVVFYIILGYLSYNDYKTGDFCVNKLQSPWKKRVYAVLLLLVYIALGFALGILMYLMNT